MAVHGIIVAAGASTRAGGDVPKQLIDLGGRPVVAWSVGAFVEAGIGSLVVVAAGTHLEAIGNAARTQAANVVVVEGGATRAASVRRGLEALEAADDDIVLVHDAARPLVSPRLVSVVIEATRASGAAMPVLPVTDTLVAAKGDVAAGAVDRRAMRRVQTPQGFRLDLIAEAHRRAIEAGDEDPTDDAGLVSRHLDIRVTLVPGEETNLKITTPSDLVVVAAHLADRQRSEQPQHRRVDPA